MSTKLIANYLPQYHRIPENDLWWGEGYTDWVAVKNAKPLFEGHEQPRIPLNHNYYSLDDVNVIRKQAELAKSHGIAGFGIYHYWFSSDMHLLDKPANILLSETDIDIDFMFIWDNASWKRSWDNIKFANDWSPLYEQKEQSKGQKGILAELDYGNETDWLKHFEYLLPFFRDKRYVKINGCPVFSFYNQNNNSELLIKMCKCWNDAAKENGLPGIVFLGKKNNQNISIMDYDFFYEPEWNGWLWHNRLERVANKIRKSFAQMLKRPLIYDYKKIWKKILKTAKKNKNKHVFFGGFVAYDDTPRRGGNGKIVKNYSNSMFENNLTELLKISNENKKELTFITAWNEWGEGAYLEPDELNELNYLQAVKNAVEKASYHYGKKY